MAVNLMESLMLGQGDPDDADDGAGDDDDDDDEEEEEEEDDNDEENNERVYIDITMTRFIIMI